ncbi:MAG: efflux RND transporter periplasmic adaptor subunit [Armatimonadota bacterium]
MKRFTVYFVLALLLMAGAAFAEGSATARAGKFTVEVTSQPSPPIDGTNLFIITVKDGSKPLSGAGVSVHADMTTMPMPVDATATPGRNEGEYGATLNLGMKGAWKLDVAVQQMAGMKMDGDGTAHFLIETGKGITGKGGMEIPWFGIFTAFIIAAVLGTLLFHKRLPQQTRGVVIGILTLLVVLFGTITVVRKYRDTKTATVIGSAVMDMDTSTAAPGTVAVATETIHPTSFQAQASYTGTVVPDIEEDIYPRVTGRLVMMPFYPGDRVAAGQVVAKLDSSELAAKEAQAAYGSLSASQGVSAADADISTARAGQTKALRAVDQAEAQLAQVRSAAKGADSAAKAAQSDLEAARQMAKEAASMVLANQSGIDQANEAVVQAQSDVESMQADVTYWTSEIAREKKLFEQGAIAREELDRETAQAAVANAKLNQAKAGVRTAQAGVNRAKQEYAQAQARQAAAQAAISTAEAKLEQARADRDAAQGRIIEAQAAVQTAQADVRASEAGVTGASAKAGMARASSLQAKAMLTEASTVRGYTTIRASSGGVVTARNIAPGVLVEPGMSIMKIAKVNVVRIQANVSEADLAQVQVGQLLTAHSIDTPNQPITARISAIFPARDTTARTAIVEARVPNPGMRLMPGQYLSIEIGLGGGQRPALSVMNSALISRDGHTSVFVAESDGMRTTAKRVDVTIGRLSNDRMEITSGLEDGDAVITSGLANLRDGDAVTVVKTSETALQPLPEPNMMPAPSKPATSSMTPPSSKPVAKATYACPMHPEVTNTKPGKCPKCGMDLVRQAAPTAAKPVYECPMHPEVTSNKPGSKCPKCGMDLEKKK